MATCVPAISKEYLHVPVTSSSSPTSYPVEMAVVAHGQTPVTGDWKVAAWDGTDAKALIGPGTSLVLAAGVYGVWVRVTTPDERPVMYSGAVKIT